MFEIYMNIPQLPRCRAAGRQGLIYKKNRQKITPRSLAARPPGSGAAGRPAEGRPLHQCRGLAAVRMILCYEDTKQEQPLNKSTRIVSWQQVSFFLKDTAGNKSLTTNQWLQITDRLGFSCSIGSEDGFTNPCDFGHV